MIPLLRHIFRTGILTEPVPEAEGGPRREIDRLHDEILHVLGRALTIREVDAGSCNGCELEIHALNNPTTTSKGAASSSSPARAMPTSCWSPGVSSRATTTDSRTLG